MQIEGSNVHRQAVIDLLIPAYTSRPRENQRVGRVLVTTEVPGLATALRRPALPLRLQLTHLNGQTFDVGVMFPDQVAALVLKSLATRVRDRATDVVDVWRCLEIAYAAGVDREHLDDDETIQAAKLIRELFATKDGRGMTALRTEQALSGVATDQRFTRLQALMARVLAHA